MTQTPDARTDVCRSCGGRLVDEDDYSFRRKLRRAAAFAVMGAAICAAWAPVFCIVRLIIGGGFGNVEGSVAAFLAVVILKKLIVGAILGALVGAMTGAWGGDAGLLLGAVAGVLGGFFIATVSSLPLRADAAHRPDVVIVALAGGVLCAVTAHLVDVKGAIKYAASIGPEPKNE